MSHRRSLLVSLAAGGGAAALALAVTVGASSAFAVSVPTSQTSPSGDGLHDALTEPGDVVKDVTDRISADGGAPAPSPGTGSGGTSDDAPLAPVGSAVKEVLRPADEKTADTPLARVVPGSGPGEVLKLSVNAAPLAKACVQVTGTGTAVANLDVTVGGHDISTPLIEALPGLLAPCPSGSAPESEGADASVSELVGACVRVKAEPPLEASVLLLDHELVAELIEAGVPLEKLVVPCPRPAGDGDGSGPGNDGGSDGDGSDGSDGGAGDGSDGGTTGGGSAGGSGTSSSTGDDACEPTITAQTTASSFLPTSGPQALPWLLLALALVGRGRLTHLVGLVRSGGATRATEL
ncbi:hypothetical protein [Intrasporangium calvum]|uniref:Secreted protein n=1 Tax=Intrasporangium calvum (strain ATCC 23552 / DSM 43043 / JCM 3097 / NBRC 12989 / NCIMB 10167 / NRRL B-3866 / 7 KIP) TaxID=710696 RepID=E6SFR9_INTC7|nr:hypothetical protein [Intrasporangium calvum]ADU48848.1 hypothetical protein Intca_2339 [Intrasporangium calvum DSM 43043]